MPCRRRIRRAVRARPAGDTQNCSFTHDDLGRLASVNCGGEWSQTFTTDAFGDVAVTSGSNDAFPASFSNDRISTVNGFAPNYDNDGNLLDNPVAQTRNVYAWNANGRPVTVDGVSQTFDAFGRLVYNTAGPRQVVWTPDGYKAAVMNGQALTFALVPLPGGAVANFGPSGISYYAHPDWEGSWRLASSPSRTETGDLAYSPYGATYAGSGPDAFTGQWVDTPDNLNDFPRRFLQPMMARWLSPDPSGLAAGNPANPQSWNAYAYVGDTPLQATDPLGLHPPTPLITLALGFSVNNNGPSGWWSAPMFSGGVPAIYSAAFGGSDAWGGWGPPVAVIPRTSAGGTAKGSGKGPPQTPVNCSTVLPNGMTVGDVVRGDIAAIRGADAIDSGLNGPPPQVYSLTSFLVVAFPGGPIDFKNQFRGQANAALLGREGNFAYYATGSAFFPAAVLDAGAGAYGVLTATFGSRHFRNLTGPFFSDSSAASVRSAGLASNGCRQ